MLDELLNQALRQRTQLIIAQRAHLGEFGLVAAQGPSVRNTGQRHKFSDIAGGSYSQHQEGGTAVGAGTLGAVACSSWLGSKSEGMIASKRLPVGLDDASDRSPL